MIKKMLTLLNILVSSSFVKMGGAIKRTSDDCVILGNGPSLNEFLNKNRGFLIEKDSIAVNFFARTELYRLIKPNHYVIAAPQYWLGDSHSGYESSRRKTLNAIAEITNWEMTFHVPMIAKSNKRWENPFKKNSYLNIRYFNSTPIDSFGSFADWCYKMNLGLPRPHNVLIPAIFLAIQAGYKRVYLLGADHSWLSELYVTTDNEVLASQKHFYDKKFESDRINNAEPKPLSNMGAKENKGIAEVVEKFRVTFASHCRLQEYALLKQCKVVNVTENSFIDAYPRKLIR